VDAVSARMSRTRVWLAALAVCGALGLYVLHGLRPQPAATPASAHVDSAIGQPATPASTNRTSGSDTRPAEARNQPTVVPQPANEPQPPRSAEVPAPEHLEAETALLAHVDGHRGLDGAAISALIRGDSFPDFMDRLEREAATSALALEIAELYMQSAEQANAAAGDDVAIRLVCGLNVCAVSATAPSKEVFDAWFQAFIGNPAAPPYGAGRHDTLTAGGATEHRIVFSSDPERQHVIMRSAGPGAPPP